MQEYIAKRWGPEQTEEEQAEQAPEDVEVKCHGSMSLPRLGISND